jgi:glycosidase
MVDINGEHDQYVFKSNLTAKKLTKNITLQSIELKTVQKVRNFYYGNHQGEEGLYGEDAEVFDTSNRYALLDGEEEQEKKSRKKKTLMKNPYKYLHTGS